MSLWMGSSPASVEFFSSYDDGGVIVLERWRRRRGLEKSLVEVEVARRSGDGRCTTPHTR